MNKAREWLNKNSAVITIVAVVVLVFALAAIIWQSKPRRYEPQAVDVYYFDLGTNQLFLAKNSEIPPIDSPSGPDMGVRAYIFSCGDCADQSQRFIGWLEMYTPEGKQVAQTLRDSENVIMDNPELVEALERGRRIRASDSQDWVSADSDTGFQIMQRLQAACGTNVMPKPCYPED